MCWLDKEAAERILEEALDLILSVHRASTTLQEERDDICTAGEWLIEEGLRKIATGGGTLIRWATATALTTISEKRVRKILFNFNPEDFIDGELIVETLTIILDHEIGNARSFNARRN